MNKIYKFLFFKIFKNKDFAGILEIKTKNKTYSFGSECCSEKKIKQVDLKIIDDRFFSKIIVLGDIGLGEAYFLNYFETNDLKNLLLWFVQNKDKLPSFEEDKNPFFFDIARVLSRLAHKKNENTKAGSKKNISSHYDVSNDFYKLWLDETMTYSSAIFESDMSLKEAQENKYKKICEKLEISESDKVLEIGSGWGGFSIYAAKNYGCRINTVTISQEQYKLAKERIKKEGLADKVKINLQDYRDLEGKYDKIVSIEMMEALGHKYVPLFLDKCYSLLKQGGMMAFQFITIPGISFETYLRNNNYIKKYIFPGGELINMDQVQTEIDKKDDLHIVDKESIGQDYASTLSKWGKNMQAKKEEVIALGFDEEFFRKWYYYFVYCEVGFEASYLDDLQLFIHKKL